MKAIIRDNKTGKVVEAYSTTDFPFSPDGAPVWTDGTDAFFCVDEPSARYELLQVEVSDRYDIGLYLRYLRRLRRVSFSDIEEATGYSARTVKSVEAGKFAPSTDVVTNLMAALGAHLVAVTEQDYSCGIPEDRFGLNRIGDNVVVIDAEHDLTMSFEAGKFNETQDVTAPTGVPDAMTLARVMREIADWLQFYHPELLKK